MALLATSCSDKSVRIWCSRTYELMGALRGHTDEIQCICFNSDATKIATASDDATVRVWDAVGMTEILCLDQESYVSYVCFSISDDHIAFRVDVLEVVVWNIMSNQMIRSILVEPCVATTLSFINNDEMIIGASALGTVAIWDLCTYKELQSFILDPPNDCTEFAISPSWDIVAVASTDCAIHLWCAISAVKIGMLNGHRLPVTGLSFRWDGSQLASCSHDRLLYVWNVSSAAKVISMEVDYGCRSISFNLEGDRVACGTDNNEVIIIDVSKHGEEIATLGCHLGLGKSLCYSREALILM